MSAAVASEQLLDRSLGTSIQQKIDSLINDLLTSLPNPKHLARDERRGIISRYTAVLEGNFIYWMTAGYLSVRSEEARVIILDNLREEVRDAHPAMLRKFAVAAQAYPTDSDAFAVDSDLTEVRLFLGGLSGVRTVLMMAFFEGFIQKFMSFLAELAEGQGSMEREYTDVHGICDITHTEGLYRALVAEMALDPIEPSERFFQGVDLLRKLIERIIDPT